MSPSTFSDTVCEATLKEPPESADETVDHQRKYNADYACDRNMNRQSEGEDKEAEIKYDGGTQPEGLSVIQKGSLKIRTDKSSYHKSDKHQQNRQPVSFSQNKTSSFFRIVVPCPLPVRNTILRIKHYSNIKLAACTQKSKNKF